jgi:ATP-dependent exoDNAse (exonuclease V) beta subunit
LADEEAPQRVWQVVPTAQRPEAPAWVVGSIVHEALALWRFPGPGFDNWAASRARGYGLTDPQQLHHARRETSRLLRRFQQHALFQEIETAGKRLHEVPYSYLRNGAMETGYIDLLYQREGVWTLVDFKTDRVRNEADLQRLLVEKDYREQVERYGTAVRQLMGVVPKRLLCFLNIANQVWLIEN